VKSENDFGIVRGAFTIGGCEHFQRRIFLARNIRRNTSDIRQLEGHDL